MSKEKIKTTKEKEKTEKKILKGYTIYRDGKRYNFQAESLEDAINQFNLLTKKQNE